jgi:hypothetical protein
VEGLDDLRKKQFPSCPGLCMDLIISGMPLIARIYGFISECFRIREGKSTIERPSCRLAGWRSGPGKRCGRDKLGRVLRPTLAGGRGG